LTVLWRHARVPLLKVGLGADRQCDHERQNRPRSATASHRSDASGRGQLRGRVIWESRSGRVKARGRESTQLHPRRSCERVRRGGVTVNGAVPPPRRGDRPCPSGLSAYSSRERRAVLLVHRFERYRSRGIFSNSRTGRCVSPVERMAPTSRGLSQQTTACTVRGEW
jgi:hypothetical protein